MTPEPKMSSEGDFQSAVLSALKHRWERRSQGNVSCVVLQPFGLDVAILVTSLLGTAFRFIEFKVYTAQRPGGVGFGDQRGDGPQVDLLMLPDPLLTSLDPNVRWCFADLTLREGQRRYSAITCVEAKQAAMGKVSHGKQNNFRVKDALARPLAWDELLGALENFLLGDS